MKKHRNSQKRYYDTNEIYFVTVKTQNNYPYFKEKMFCNLFIDEIKLCKKLKKFNLFAFCIMYDHVHFLLQPGEKYNISKVMQFLKRHFTRNVNYIIGYNNELNPINEGDIGQCRLPKEEQDMIKEFIMNVKDYREQFIKKYRFDKTLPPKFKWQKSYYDHIIRNEHDMVYYYDYTAYNFQKHNLPDDWQYTSLNYEKVVDKILI
ncbi:transposase [Patescibacteria group bacterium]|nr:transposase [Patescibacteria group bacterium]